MQKKVGLFAIFPLFVLMIVPIYADVTTLTLEKISTLLMKRSHFLEQKMKEVK